MMREESKASETISSTTFDGIAQELLQHESVDPAKLLATVQSMSEVINALRALDLSTVEPATILRLRKGKDA